jgi:perosamine synthetase
MIGRIPHSRPSVGLAETKALMSVIASRQLAGGAQVSALERELSALVRHRFGIAVSSGTAALYLALRGLDIGNGDVVVIPSYVCTALLNAIAFAGATAALCDVDPGTGLMEPDRVYKILTPKVRAIIVPHLFGCPVDAAGIEALGIPVIEDCAQCLGTTVNGKPVGGLTKVSIFSFYATKVLSAGEGGLIATSDKRLADRIIDLKEYDNRENFKPRFNFKLSDLQAAVARAQLKKLPQFVDRRRTIAQQFQTSLAAQSAAITIPADPPDRPSIYFRFVVNAAGNRDAIETFLIKRGITCARPIFKPLHHYLGLQGYPGADTKFNQAISIPLYPALEKSEIDYICDTLENLDSYGTT